MTIKWYLWCRASKPRTSFVVTITSFEDNNEHYQWISYMCLPAARTYKLCDAQTYLRI